jgi:hypothetical protein
MKTYDVTYQPLLDKTTERFTYSIRACMKTRLEQSSLHICLSSRTSERQNSNSAQQGAIEVGILLHNIASFLLCSPIQGGTAIIGVSYRIIPDPTRYQPNVIKDSCNRICAELIM